MIRTRPLDGTWPRFGRALPGIALALAFALVPATAAFATDADDDVPEISEEDQVCLDCHAKPGVHKRLENGERKSVYVSPRAFAASMHGEEGCEACHTQIDLEAHGEPHQAVVSELGRLEVMETCRDCHKKAIKAYEDSVHLALVNDGSSDAPLCADCHDPHATRAVEDYTAHDGSELCGNCHEEIADAYAMSVHAQPGDDALACNDCHRSHDVKAATFGEHLKDQCVSCHEDVAATHADWLPNSGRHLEAIACVACHSPNSMRRVNLRLYQGGAQHQVSDTHGVPQFVRTGGNGSDVAGLDGFALWSLLQDFSRKDGENRAVVRGRLEVQTAAEAHALTGKERAISDCDTCHRKGAASFQSVTISMAGPDGRPLRQDASMGLLTSIESIGAVSGFYALGSTRILLLDILLLLALGAGIVIPGTHLTAKLITARRRNREADPSHPTDAGER